MPLEGERQAYATVLGFFVQHYRKKKGLTQIELAQTGVSSQAQLSRIERGTLIPDAWTLRLIEKELDIADLDDLTRLAVKKAGMALNHLLQGSVGLPRAPDWETANALERGKAVRGLLIFAASILLLWEEEDDETPD